MIKVLKGEWPIKGHRNRSARLGLDARGTGLRREKGENNDTEIRQKPKERKCIKTILDQKKKKRLSEDGMECVNNQRAMQQ